MTARLQITFRNMKSTDEIQNWVRAEAAKLQRFYSRLLRCRVALELLHSHHQNGNLYHVRIDLAVPGGVIVIGREPTFRSQIRRLGERVMQKSRELNPAHQNLHTAISDAFKAAGRRLQEYASRRRVSPPLQIGASVTLRTRPMSTPSRGLNRPGES